MVDKKICDFCFEEIEEGHQYWEVIQSDDIKNKRDMCYNCEAMIRHQEKSSEE